MIFSCMIKSTSFARWASAISASKSVSALTYSRPKELNCTSETVHKGAYFGSIPSV